MAALAFVERGDSGPLSDFLTAHCRPGLIGQVVASWYELHCSQRLQLILSAVAIDTGVVWTSEAGVPQLSWRKPSTRSLRTDLRGRSLSGERILVIEVKQVNVVLDLAIFETELDMARSDAERMRNKDIYNEAVLRCAERLATMPADELLGLTFRTSSVKVWGQQLHCVRDVVAGAIAQAQKYAHRWAQDSSVLRVEAYIVVAVGPLRWHIEKVSLPQQQ